MRYLDCDDLGDLDNIYQDLQDEIMTQFPSELRQNGGKCFDVALGKLPCCRVSKHPPPCFVHVGLQLATWRCAC
jgi:hypothetical protein